MIWQVSYVVVKDMTNQQMLLQAERLYKECLALQNNLSASCKTVKIAFLTDLAGVQMALSKTEHATKTIQKSLRKLSVALGPCHPDTALCQCLFAGCKVDMKQWALPVFSSATLTENSHVHTESWASYFCLHGMYWLIVRMPAQEQVCYWFLCPFISIIGSIWK